MENVKNYLITEKLMNRLQEIADILSDIEDEFPELLNEVGAYITFKGKTLEFDSEKFVESNYIKISV